MVMVVVVVMVFVVVMVVVVFVVVMVVVVFVVSAHGPGRRRGHGVVVVVVVGGCGRRGGGGVLKRAVGDLDHGRLVLGTRGADSVAQERGEAGRRREGRGWGGWVGLHAPDVSPFLLIIFVLGAYEDGALPTKHRKSLCDLVADQTYFSLTNKVL
ncbi:unnamed protein product [Ectocarpus fasciculatus]